MAPWDYNPLLYLSTIPIQRTFLLCLEWPKCIYFELHQSVKLCWYWPYAGGHIDIELLRDATKVQFCSEMDIRDSELLYVQPRQRGHLNFSDRQTFTLNILFSEFCPVSILTKHHFVGPHSSLKLKLLRLKTWKFVMTQQKHFMWNKVPHKFKTLKTSRADLLKYKRQNSFSILFQYDYSFEDKINLLAWEVARLWLCAEGRREKRELNYSQTKPAVSRHKIDSKQNHQCSWWIQSHK